MATPTAAGAGGGAGGSGSGSGVNALNPFGSRAKLPMSLRKNMAEIIAFLRANRGRQSLRVIEGRLNQQLEGIESGIEANAALVAELHTNPKVVWHDTPQLALEYRPTYGMVKTRTDLITLLWNAALTGIVWDDLSDAYDGVDDDLKALFRADKLIAVHHDSVAIVHDDSQGKSAAATAAAIAAAARAAPTSVAAQSAALHAAKQAARISKQDQLVEVLLTPKLTAAQVAAEKKAQEQSDALAGATAADQRKRKQLADGEHTKLRRAVSLFWRERRLPGGAGYSAAVLEQATAKLLAAQPSASAKAEPLDEPHAKRVKAEAGASASASGAAAPAPTPFEAASAAALAATPLADQEIALDVDVRQLWTDIKMPPTMLELEKVLAAKGHLTQRDASNVTKAAMAQVATLAKPKARKKPSSSRPIKLTNIHLVNDASYDWLRPQATAAGLHIPSDTGKGTAEAAAAAAHK